MPDDPQTAVASPHIDGESLARYLRAVAYALARVLAGHEGSRCGRGVRMTDVRTELGDAVREVVAVVEACIRAGDRPREDWIVATLKGALDAAPVVEAPRPCFLCEWEGQSVGVPGPYNPPTAAGPFCERHNAPAAPSFTEEDVKRVRDAIFDDRYGGRLDENDLYNDSDFMEHIDYEARLALRAFTREGS